MKGNGEQISQECESNSTTLNFNFLDQVFSFPSLLSYPLFFLMEKCHGYILLRLLLVWVFYLYFCSALRARHDSTLLNCFYFHKTATTCYIVLVNHCGSNNGNIYWVVESSCNPVRPLISQFQTQSMPVLTFFSVFILLRFRNALTTLLMSHGQTNNVHCKKIKRLITMRENVTVFQVYPLSE